MNKVSLIIELWAYFISSCDVPISESIVDSEILGFSLDNFDRVHADMAIVSIPGLRSTILISLIINPDLISFSWYLKQSDAMLPKDHIARSHIFDFF